MSPIAFGLTYLGLWLLVGLGLFVTVEAATSLIRHGASLLQRPSGDPIRVATGILLGALLLVIGALATSVGSYGVYTVVYR